MPQSALQLDLPRHDPPGNVPWYIAVIALMLLGVSLTYTLERIPRALEAQAQRLLQQGDAPTVDLRVDGRDITLFGTIDIDRDRQALVDALAAIPGVRVVRDEMRESDPAEQSRLEALAFRRALELLDFRQVRFAPGGVTLEASPVPVLDQLVELLERYPRTRIRIAGHTDNTGRSSVNLRISRERASEIARYLTHQGIDPSRLIAQGYGDTQPVADNATAAGRARNRRISVSYID